MSKNLTMAATCGALLMLLLAGCTTTSVSGGITDGGKVGAPVFPNIEQSAWQKEGTFPSIEKLRLIGPGVSKDQLYELVGRPHFREGFGAVREWDYIFNFRDGKEVVTCQYKVVFDKEAHGQSFRWSPAACAERLVVTAGATPPPVERVVERVVLSPPVAPVAMIAPDPAPQRIQVASDVLFAYDRGDAKDILPGGARELARIADSLKARGIERLEVVGHTDRLGSASYNQQLSEARAQAVRDLLAASGLPIDRIVARGEGMRSPIVDCDTVKERSALIGCLAPNRHVEILAWTVHGI